MKRDLTTRSIILDTRERLEIEEWRNNRFFKNGVESWN